MAKANARPLCRATNRNLDPRPHSGEVRISKSTISKSTISKSPIEYRSKVPRQATFAERALASELKLAPESIAHHVSLVRALLGLSERQVRSAVLAYPQVLLRSPAEIDRQISKTAAIFEIMKPRVAVAAMRSPFLLMILPAQLKRRLPLVMQLAIIRSLKHARRRA